MTTFTIPDMTCGHCAGVVTETVKSLDPGAEVQVEVMDKKVSVKSTASDRAILAALAEAGYPAEPVA
jgi:copper chaperone